MKCLLCNKEYPKLKNHLNKVHKLNEKSYYDEYIIKSDKVQVCGLDGCNEPVKFIALWRGYAKACCKDHSSKLRRQSQARSLKESGKASKIASKRAKKQFSKMSDKERSDFARKGYHSELPSLGGKARMNNLRESGELSSHQSRISRTFWTSLSDDEKDDLIRSNQIKSYKRKSYNTGTKVFNDLQGYEVKALKILLKDYDENDILAHPKSIRSSEFFYLPDFYIKSTNTLVEVKSKFTAKVDKRLKMKQELCISLGYKFKLMVL